MYFQKTFQRPLQRPFQKNNNNNKNYLFYFLLFFLFTVANISLAESALYLKGYGGVNFTVDNDFETSDVLDLIDDSEIEYETGNVFGFSAGYRMHNGLAFELDYSTRANDIDSISIDTFRVEGDIESSALLFNLAYYPSYGRLITPYFGGGIGVLSEIDATIELDDDFFDDFDDSSLAWQVFAGVNVSVFENLSFFGEARFFSGPGPELENDFGEIDTDYNNVSFLLGLNFSLN